VGELISISDAQSTMLDACPILDAERIPLAVSACRVLAETICATLDLPAFDNSSMDGFAVRAADIAGAERNRPVELQVVGDLPAGQVAQQALGNGEAMRVMTGAPLPAGADAVIPVEETDIESLQTGAAAPLRVKIYRSAAIGENVRPRGQDARAGEVLLEKGRLLRAREIGLLAMVGVSQVLVYRKPKVAVLSTGNELTPVGQPLQPGKIYDSNSHVLAVLISRFHGEALFKGVVPDNEEAIQACLDESVAEGADLILSSGGVSVGAFDYVRSVVEKFGHLTIWRVNMRPGKPIAFGSYRGVPFIGLPGNPVSAFVGFEVFVRPVLAKMSGMSAWCRRTHRVKTLDELTSDGRESYLRAFVWQEQDEWKARLVGHQGSGNLRSLVEANALLLVPSGVKSLPIGSEVTAWLLEE